MPVAMLSALLLPWAGTARVEAAEAVPVPPAPPPFPVVPLSSPPEGPPEAPPEAPQPARGAWYGGTILAFDGAMIVTGLGCAALSDNDGCQLPIYGYLLGGPIIHGRHHGWGRAFASVGLRLGLPLVGLLVGLGAGSSNGCGESHSEACWPSFLGGAIGAGIGAVAAIAIDATWAYDDAPAPTSPASPSPLAFSPALSLGRGGGAIGLQGRF